MPLTLPVSIDAEYRGVAPASEFADRETGETVELQPNLKFEYEDADGDVLLIPIRRNRVDEAADFDAETLSKGDRVHIEGRVTLADRGSGRESFFRVVAVRRIEPAARPARAAAAS